MPPALAVKKNGGFDPGVFLATIGIGRKILEVPKKQAIFAQGDEADAVFYVQKGKVRLTVVSKIGKEATIAIVNQGNFFGEGSLAGQLLRMGSAAAMTDCEILRVEKKVMMDALHRLRFRQFLQLLKGVSDFTFQFGIFFRGHALLRLASLPAIWAATETSIYNVARRP
jgi:hypothetical protein